MQATAKPEVLITNSYVTLAEALSGNISSDHNLPGQCMNFASLSVGLSRAIGIPSRMATGGGSGFVDATATWIPNVNTFQPDYSELPWWWHVWTEAWLENPPSGSDKWYVFDGTDYVGSPYGSSASRRDYGSKWLPSTGRVTIFDFDAEAEVIEVTNLYR
jgi:transglutaminase-like putative cysteine protease